MIAYCSPSAGVLVPDTPGVNTDGLVFLCGDAAWSAAERRHFLSLVDDWEIIDGISSEDLVSKFTSLFRLDRATSYATILMDGTPGELEIEILEYLEETLQTVVQLESLVDRLIVAPLRHPDRAASLAKSALGRNFAATALLYETIHDVQPLLRRLTDYWLDIPPNQLAEVGISPSDVWNLACSSGTVREALARPTRTVFETRWNALALDENVFPTPASRIAFLRVVSDLSARMFPGAQADPREVAATFENDCQHDEQRDNTDPRIRFKQAIKQIEAITQAVATAKDNKARRFLRELVAEQRRFVGGDDFAVKSLCNIAQRCADLFRTDFERSCLDLALKILPTDSWTLRQYADHLKRIGEFEASIKAYERAATCGDSQYAHAGIADVWSEQGEYGKAIKFYKQIPGWSENAMIRTAIADNLRRLGRYEDAEREYLDILSSGVGLDCSRALAGRGDIARRRGDLMEARRIYESLFNCADERARRIYRITLCDLLKQMGDLEEAVRIADALVREAPFFLQARIKRGSILAMLNKEEEALSDIPAGGIPRAFGEWMRGYFRGLLLFKLRRYSEAKVELTEHLTAALKRGDDRAIIRLGAAFAHLHGNAFDRAQSELDAVAASGDPFAQYISDVLRLHLAVARKDEQAVETYVQKLDKAMSFSPLIAKAVHSLLSGMLSQAFALEANLLLAVSPDMGTAA